MKNKVVTLIITAMTLTTLLSSQSFEITKVKSIEHQLEDVMEILDTTELKHTLKEVTVQFQQNVTEMTKARLGIIYHETALNLSFLSKTEYKGYAKKSFDLLDELSTDSTTTKELLPFVTAYRASALALVGAETKKLKFLKQSFVLFENSVKNYSDVSYVPEFLRGSVAENLPWYFVSKRKAAKNDFESIIKKQEKDALYATSKIMSFTYWAWAKQHTAKKQRPRALGYLDKAIALDPQYKAGRSRAEELKKKLE